MPTVPKKRRISPKKRLVLKLYVAGATHRSQSAITRLTALCEEYSKDCIDLEVLDLYQLPLLAQKAGVVATPTLLKKLPLPVRRMIGDLSERKKVLMFLGLQDVADPHG
jgi:circadian clock protein KaiB